MLIITTDYQTQAISMPSVSARFAQHSAPPYPPERLLLQSNRYGGPHKTRQDNIAGGAGGQRLLSHPLLLLTVHFYSDSMRSSLQRKKMKPSQKKINYIEKKIVARQNCAPVKNG